MSAFVFANDSSGVFASALARCDFPYDSLLPGLKAASGRDAIEVSFASLPAGDEGLAYSDGRIEVSTALDPDTAGTVFLIESGHSVDFFLMTDAQRQAVYSLFHPAGIDNDAWFDPSAYWDRVGEAWTVAFVWAFTDLRPDSPYSHKPTEAIAASIRVLFGLPPRGVVPIPVPPPQPQPQPQPQPPHTGPHPEPNPGPAPKPKPKPKPKPLPAWLIRLLRLLGLAP